jgi:single-stranded DNA-binding protein
MQHLTIAGNVGKDAELRTAGTEQVLNFSLAVDNGKVIQAANCHGT